MKKVARYSVRPTTITSYLPSNKQATFDDNRVVNLDLASTFTLETLMIRFLPCRTEDPFGPAARGTAPWNCKCN